MSATSNTAVFQPCQYQSVTMDHWEPGKLSRPSLFLFWDSKFSDRQKHNKTGELFLLSPALSRPVFQTLRDIIR